MESAARRCLASIFASTDRGEHVAYTQARKSKTKGTRYIGYYSTPTEAEGGGDVRLATMRPCESPKAQEDHVRAAARGNPAREKATMTIEEFAKSRFLPRIEITPKAKQTYKSHLKNHVYPYLGRERIAEISREQLYTHLVTTLPEAGATLVTRRAVRTVLSSMLQMAWNEQYRNDNPVRHHHPEAGPRRSPFLCPPMPSGTGWRRPFPSAPRWSTRG